MKFLLSVLFAAVPALLLGGCATVYVPTLPATPLLEKGQVEVVGSLRGVTTLGLSAAWAPTRHLLLVGESGFDESETDYSQGPAKQKFHDYNRQASLGLGYYRSPTAHSSLYWAVVGGMGLATASVHAVNTDERRLFAHVSYDGYFRADYRRYYGQVYLADYHASGCTIGGSVRASLVDYTRLTLDGATVSPENRVFMEPMLFLRTKPGLLQLQFSIGVSLPLAEGHGINRAYTAPTSSLIGLGIIFRPDLLKKW